MLYQQQATALEKALQSRARMRLHFGFFILAPPQISILRSSVSLNARTCLRGVRQHGFSHERDASLSLGFWAKKRQKLVAACTVAFVCCLNQALGHLGGGWLFLAAWQGSGGTLSQTLSSIARFYWDIQPLHSCQPLLPASGRIRTQFGTEKLRSRQISTTWRLGMGLRAGKHCAFFETAFSHLATKGSREACFP